MISQTANDLSQLWLVSQKGLEKKHWTDLSKKTAELSFLPMKNKSAIRENIFQVTGLKRTIYIHHYNNPFAITSAIWGQ